MFLFGCTFCSHPDDGTHCSIKDINIGQCECERANYDSLFSAFLTVFQEEEKRQLEEEALKRAEEEENERKMELEMLIARTTLTAFLRKKCSCGQDNISVVREQLGKKILENERRKSRQFSISADSKDLVQQQQKLRRQSYTPGRRLTWQRHSSLIPPKGPQIDSLQQV
uniref:Cilia- and flagella-associated protein 36 n=1 Tax=Meloidogyne hapla TaxID=6305 RepID=A0A1I8B279_MELHA